MMRLPGPAVCLVVFVVLALVGPSQTAAQEVDWGATLDSATNLRSAPHRSDHEWEQLVRFALWAELFVELREERTVRLATEGSYRFEYDQGDDDDPLHILNLDLLRLSAGLPMLFGPGSALELSAGRFRFNDPTRVVWNHAGDGLSVSVGFPRWSARVSAAYTGLLLNAVSDIRMTPTDALEEDDTDQTLGPQRIIGLAGLAFPELVQRQNLTLFGILQFDLRDPDQGEETLDTQYVGAVIDGPVEITRGLYYSVFAIKGFGTWDVEGGEDESISSGAYGARLRLFRERLRYSRASVEWLHASGGGSMDAFTVINDPATGFTFSPGLADLMLASAGYSLRPLSNTTTSVAAGIRTGLTVRSFLRSTTGADGVFSAPGLDTESDARYVGSEGELRITLRPTRELGFAFTNGVFFPNGELFTDSDPWYRGRLEVSIGY